MKILLTGATGFIGDKVLKKIIPKYGKSSVIALSSNKIDGVKTILSKHYDFSENYLSENGCSDIDILMHIGAFAPKSSHDTNVIELNTGNITSTWMLLRSVLPNLKKIIYISTLDVYARCAGTLSENTDTIPSTLYGWSKLYCEQMVLNYCRENGLDYEILRLGHVYGEGEEKYRKVMPTMIENAIKGNDLTIYGDGKAIRSFIYIEDVVQAIVNSIELKTSEIINVVSNEPVTINRLAELIQAMADGGIRITHIQSNIPNVDYIFDNSKLRRYLLNSFTSLEDGLRHEYNYMKEKLKILA